MNPKCYKSVINGLSVSSWCDDLLHGFIQNPLIFIWFSPLRSVSAHPHPIFEIYGGKIEVSDRGIRQLWFFPVSALSAIS